MRKHTDIRQKRNQEHEDRALWGRASAGSLASAGVSRSGSNEPKDADGRSTRQKLNLANLDCERHMTRRPAASSLQSLPVYSSTPRSQRVQKLVPTNACLTNRTLQCSDSQNSVHWHGDAPVASRQPVCLTTENPSRSKALTVCTPETSRGSFTPGPESDHSQSESGCDAALPPHRSE